MITFYTVIVLEIIFLMIILGIMVNTNDLLPQHKRRMFLMLTTIIILAVAAEWSGSMTVLFDGSFRQLHIWTKVLELTLTPVVPFLCAEILNQSARFFGRVRWFYYILLVHTGLEVFSAFEGFIFYVDENDVFRHGPFYWLYLVTYSSASVYVLLVGYQVSRKYQNKNRFILIPMLALLLFGIAANQYDKSIKTAWLTVSLVVMLIYIFYNGMLQRMDEMTMMLNRTSYDNRLSRIHRPVIIQFFDVDYFKTVNDEYGHLYGDNCLRNLGKIIRRTYGKYGTCYRIGGDEFCVILDSAEFPIDELNTQFFSEMRKHRETDENFPFVSLGYSKYDPSCESIVDAIQRADSVMYNYKERNKIKYGPIVFPALHEDISATRHAPMENGKPAQGESLDTSGLTDRTFAAFSNTSDRSYHYLCNMTTLVSRWSASAVKYFDLPSEYMFHADKIWESHIHPQDRKMFRENINAVFSGQIKTHELEYRARNHRGEYVICTCRGVILKGNDTEPDLFAGTIINHGIIDNVDPITNLHNNMAFTSSLRRLIEERSAACVIKIGIEHFRHINAMYGQQGGNQVLRLFGIELRELVEGKGQVFRLEGAKFALYLYNTDRDGAREFYSRICDIAEKSIKINNFSIPLKLSAGAILLDGKQYYNDYIVRSSLIYAIEQSNENYRNELVFIEDTYKNIGVKNIQLHTNIHRSAMNGCKNFFLQFQPIISFPTGKIIGAEALLRWKRDPYGTVPPDSFIPWLENDPTFIYVGNWILRRAIEETAPLRQTNPDFVLHVNIAMTQLEHSGFREDVLHILSDSGCPPENLCLELTERCRYLDTDFLAEELKFFRSHGITIAIDDFGTGASSLALLLRLPIDVLKIDRLLLMDIFNDASHRHVMEHILECCKQAGLHSCVEGIETKEQYDLISSISDDCYQGYYCSKPVPIEEFINFYKKNEGAL